jgi:hypothetical protein
LFGKSAITSCTPTIHPGAPLIFELVANQDEIRVAPTARETMSEDIAAREERLHQLASKLSFTFQREGSRYALYREADVSRPVRHEELTLDQAEEILNRWKLRGPHGG